MTKFLADNQYIYLYFVQPLVTPTRCQTNFDQGGSDEKKHNKVHNLASSLASCQQTHDMLRRNHLRYSFQQLVTPTRCEQALPTTGTSTVPRLSAILRAKQPDQDRAWLCSYSRRSQC